MKNGVEKLSLENQNNFEETLNCVFGDTVWLNLRRLQNYSKNIVRNVLYREMFENDFSLLHAYND